MGTPAMPEQKIPEWKMPEAYMLQKMTELEKYVGIKYYLCFSLPVIIKIALFKFTILIYLS
jgi:hypothetical protein